MRKRINDVNLQQYIYDMNIVSLRTRIINSVIRNYQNRGNNFIWLGSLKFHESELINSRTRVLNRLKQKIMERSKSIFLLTCSYVYQENSIHYISIIYDQTLDQVVIFDSGYNLYQVGKNVLIPMMKDFFNSLSTNVSIKKKTTCVASNYGVQLKLLTKSLSRPDAFCQSWSLYFIISYIRNGRNLSFFEAWCSLKPKQRERFLYQNFIIPTIYSDKYLAEKYSLLALELEEELYHSVWKVKME